MTKNMLSLLRNSMHFINKMHMQNFCMKPSKHYDIIIAGGGMIGSTLACTLGKNPKLANKNILLLETTNPTAWTPRDTYSNRVSAVNLNTFNLLNEIGAWKHIANVRCSPVKSLQAWDAVSDVMISFNHDEASKVVAHIVENDLIIHAVNKEIANLQNIQIINGFKIAKYHLPENVSQDINVQLENGDNFTCNLLLGCDGVKSQVREAMGVNYISWDYHQTAVVATLELSEATENNIAWQRFLPAGPIAILPLNENLSSLVWSTTSEIAHSLMGLTDQEFVDKINDAFSRVYEDNAVVRESTRGFNKILSFLDLPSSNEKQHPPKIVGVDSLSRAGFPLGFGHATNYIKLRVALVGDAAHHVHPLAGQGVNLGFGDVSTLNNILGEAVYSGRFLGQLADLQEYETSRQRHNFPTMIAIDGLQKLYNTEFAPIVLLRSLGLQLTHALNPLKKVLIDHAGQ
ncbi:hypothetical protein FQA39_LY13640 [Lamprigera yunnana]|nr:hypothetical protein FQA39_LY13640 [Lamprigera yunnana]